MITHRVVRSLQVYGAGGRRRLSLSILYASFLAASAATAQNPASNGPAATPPATTRFEPREAFAPLTYPQAVNRYRSGDGAPGPDYWQNRVDYEIRATLDPVAKTLKATEVVSYTNNSPDTLTSLWLQLDQNIYRPGARAATATSYGAGGEVTEGYAILSVQVDRGGTVETVKPIISDTRMRVPLTTALKGGGGKLTLKIAYQYVVPGSHGGRTSWVDTPNGPIFDIAQWFPRLAVYDDVRGWDTLPYVGQEFYLEYGDIDYAVTVPADMIVAGGGELMNPREALTPEERARLAEARGSDATVLIRTPDDVAKAAGAAPVAGEKTWRYHMSNTRDVAFSASRAFIWDAARINLPGGTTALAESIYPIESAGDAAWGRSTEYLKDSVEHFSQRWFVYPYKTAWSVAGGTSGMEYPGMAFDGIPDKGKALFWITAHEIGHTWFPMTVGSDERRDAWMDEGFNTFIDTFESDDFKGGVYGPKRDSEYAPQGGNPADDILPVLADPNAPPVWTRADLIPETYRHSVTYFKAALGLRLLRDEILGPERFDAAFRKYIADWAFKHPKPSDFFREMDSEAGEDLSWWWRGWYQNNYQLDLAVANVAYVNGDAAKGVRVTVETRDKLIMPTVIELKYADGTVARIPLPVETWMQRRTAVIPVPGAGKTLVSATVDPDHELPDRDRSNNTFTLK